MNYLKHKEVTSLAMEEKREIEDKKMRKKEKSNLVDLFQMRKVLFKDKALAETQ